MNKWRLTYTVWPEHWRSEGVSHNYMYWWQAWLGKTFRVLDKYMFGDSSGTYEITEIK